MDKSGITLIKKKEIFVWNGSFFDLSVEKRMAYILQLTVLSAHLHYFLENGGIIL